jgi:hypothetical protein
MTRITRALARITGIEIGEDELLPDRIHSVHRENGTKASKRKVDVVQLLDPFFPSPPRRVAAPLNRVRSSLTATKRETAYTKTQVTMVLKRTRPGPRLALRQKQYRLVHRQPAGTESHPSTLSVALCRVNVGEVLHARVQAFLRAQFP